MNHFLIWKKREANNLIGELFFIYNLWNEMKWNEMKWNEMKWNENVKRSKRQLSIYTISAVHYPNFYIYWQYTAYPEH